MNKLDALSDVKEVWDNAELSLYERAMRISSICSESGLSVSSAAAFINATPSELGALLSLSELDDEILKRISESNPAKTTWALLANASNDEIDAAISAFNDLKNSGVRNRHTPIDEYIYGAMVMVAEPTSDQKVSVLSSDVIKAIRKRAEQYKILPDREIKFLKSITGARKSGKVLSPKQAEWLKDILVRLAEAEVIKRDGIDSDQAECDIALDALEN